MNTNRFLHLAAATLGLAVISIAASAANERPAADSLPVAGDAVTATPVAANSVSTEKVQDDADAKWSDIEFSTYDKRPAFFAGLKRLEAKVDDQITKLKAKRVIMDKKAVDVTSWDFTMKGMMEAQSYLVAMGIELNKAGREAWEQQKAKVGNAWVRTQNAYDKVKASTTF